MEFKPVKTDSASTYRVGEHASVMVVLGARLSDSGQPSPALLRRCHHAASVWSFHSNLQSIIVTGGVTGPTDVSEAAVMATVLRECGVAADRIQQEPCARNTLENMQFSLGMILERTDADRPDQVILVTDRVHMLRALVIARHLVKRIDLRVIAEPAPMGLWRSVMALPREVLAIGYNMPRLLRTAPLSLPHRGPNQSGRVQP